MTGASGRFCFIRENTKLQNLFLEVLLDKIINFVPSFLGFNMTFYQRNILKVVWVLYLALFTVVLSVNANESSMHVGPDEVSSISANENSIHINTDEETKIR